MPLLISANDRAVPIRAKLTTTSATVVTPAIGQNDFQKIASLYLINNSAGAVNVTIAVEAIEGGSPVTYTRYPTQALAANTILAADLDGHPLRQGESVKVTASVANTIQVLGALVGSAGR